MDSKMEENRLAVGGIYKDPKGNPAELICTAFDTEHSENIAVFRQMYAPFGILAIHRETFEETMTPYELAETKESRSRTDSFVSKNEPYDESSGADDTLMQFLDAGDFKEKREILKKNRDSLNSINISSMAMSLDLTLPGKDREDDIDYILSYLAANERFNGERLRS